MIAVRPGMLGDAPALAALENECFSEPWSERALAQSLTADHTCFFTAVDGESGKIVGYVGMLIAADVGEIINVAVTASYRRMGIGRALLAETERAARMRELVELQLEVRASNAPAIALYSSLGYAAVGRRKNFYRKPTEDALLMNKPLGDPGDGSVGNT